MLHAWIERSFEKMKEFMSTFPDAPPDVAIQHWASFRKASRKIGAITASRPANELLTEMIEIHMENVAVAGLASAMRAGKTPDPKAAVLDAFRSFFVMLLRRPVSSDEARILGRLGAIQVHHGRHAIPGA